MFAIARYLSIDIELDQRDVACTAFAKLNQILQVHMAENDVDLNFHNYKPRMGKKWPPMLKQKPNSVNRVND